MAMTDKEKKKLLRNAKRIFLHEYAAEMEEEAEDSMMMVNLPFIDKSKVTGSGISMGGYGIYQVMMSLPQKH